MLKDYTEILDQIGKLHLPLALKLEALECMVMASIQHHFTNTYIDEDHLNKFDNNKKRSHTQLDSRKQVIAFQDRVITINIKEAQHPLKREKQVIDKSSIMLKISTKSMHQVLV